MRPVAMMIGIAAALFFAASAPAEEQVFEGRLAAGDPVLASDGTFYRIHEFEASEADELRIDLMSEDFDAFLIVHSPTGEIFTDDDGGEGLNSRLAITANATGVWRAYANTFTEGETGRYTLRVRTLDPGPIRRFSGTLDAGSPRLPTNQGLYGEHTLEIEAGSPLTVDLMSSDFDAFLYVHSPSGQVYSDDDGGEGLNSRLTIVADEGGRWRFVATSFGGRGEGAYEMQVRVGEPGRFEARGFEGELSERSGRLPENGAFFEEHAMELEAGQEVLVDLMSDAFDALLHVHSPSGRVFTDDDGGAGTDSRLSITTDRAGEWRFVATSFRAGMQGPYRLNVTVSRPADRP